MLLADILINAGTVFMRGESVKALLGQNPDFVLETAFLHIARKEGENIGRESLFEFLVSKHIICTVDEIDVLIETYSTVDKNCLNFSE